MFGLAIAFGCVVGFALGLTGGGGGVFAVPLLVYGLSVAPREAVGISLASVGGTALFGAVPRLLQGEVELRTGLLFAASGMLGAPVGAYLSRMLPEAMLLLMFGLLMLAVAERMWSKARTQSNVGLRCAVDHTQAAESEHSACQRDQVGRLKMTSRCAQLLILVGITTGILSGMFGVGGGFVIVPSLVLFSGMEIHRAVGTSLFVIVMVSISGVISHLLNDNRLPVDITTLFMLGGFGGMFLGGRVAEQLNGPALQKIFSIAVVLVAAFVIIRTAIRAT